MFIPIAFWKEKAAFRSTKQMARSWPFRCRPLRANLNGPYGAVIDRTGQYRYATNNGNGAVSAYQIDQTTGALTPLASGATISTGTSTKCADL